jgi:hypothetical protein
VENNRYRRHDEDQGEDRGRRELEDEIGHTMVPAGYAIHDPSLSYQAATSVRE